MAEREKSQDKSNETEVAAQDDNSGVAGAHGNKKKKPQAATGVSKIRQDADDIAPTEGRDND